MRPQVCQEVMRSPKRLGDVLDFVSRRRAGTIICQRATHRSLSALTVVETVFHRRCDYQGGKRWRPCAACNSRAKHHVGRLLASARELNHCADAQLLLRDIMRG